MKTYSRRLMELAKDYSPASTMFTTAEEAEQVRRTLGLKLLNSELELRNMRDMAVMYFGRLADRAMAEEKRDEFRKTWNTMQSVTAVIDDELWKRGYSV